MCQSHNEVWKLSIIVHLGYICIVIVEQVHVHCTEGSRSLCARYFSLTACNQVIKYAAVSCAATLTEYCPLNVPGTS